MVSSLAARWLLTAVFAAAGAGLLSARGRTGSNRVSDAFHALICAALIAMTWRAQPIAPTWLQTALFSCAVLWFGLASPAAATRLRARRSSALHHVLMAGAMIWMTTAMPVIMRMPPAGPAGGAMHAMPVPAVPATIVAISVLFAAYFAIAAIPWLVRATRSGQDPHDGSAAAHAAMSAGMAAMLLAML